MSDKTPEKIWKFESPEELAQALEDKNKALADRVREISKKSIETDSKDLRKALQEELSPKEQKEIREALPDAWVSEVFTKWMTSEEQAIQKAKDGVSEMIWEKNTQTLQKVEWIWNRLSTWFDKIWDIFNEKWMMAWIGAIILMFKWIFSWDFSALDEILNPKKDEKKGEEKKEDEKNKDLTYLWWVKILYLMNWDKSKRYISSMLVQKEIKEKSFDDLKWIFKEGKEWISEKLKLKDRWSDEQVYESLKLLIDNEKFIDNILWKWNQNWRKWNIWENLINISKSWWWVIRNITDKLEKVKFSLNPVDAMNQLKWVDILDISIENGKISFWDLEDRKEILSEVSEKTLIQIIWTNESIKDLNTEQKNRLYNQTDWSEKEKWFIDKLLNYKKGIVETLSWLFWDDVKWKYTEFFNKHWIWVKELFELYMITWWKINLADMNGLEKSSLYLKLWKIVWVDEAFRWEFFDQKVIKWIENKSLPEDVQLILWTIFSKVSEWFINASSAALKEIWHAIPLKDKIIAWWAISLVVVWMVYFAPLRVVWVTAIAWIIASALTATSIKNKYTKDDIEKMIEESLKKATKI